MKRKLDETDEPSAPAAEDKRKDTEADVAFTDFGLDPRLLQAVAEQRFQKPTLVQQKAIPLALSGRDILAKAKTGSGKTAAYVLPILQSILTRKETDQTPCTSALILVPTRELVNQVTKAIESLAAFCAREVSVVKLSDAPAQDGSHKFSKAAKDAEAVQRSFLSALPDVVVATPARALCNIEAGVLVLEKLAHLVLDEADLVLSYGYEDDMQAIAKALPGKGTIQTILMSATLTTDVDTLSGMLCRNPALLDLEERDKEGEGVSQYVVKCGEDEKFLLAYVIFKLRLVTGKCIIFVADVDRCYRLKLFFEQFGIRSCVLNSELPVNSRIHTVEEFNRNVYDIIIASDENEVIGDEDAADENEGDAEDEEPKIDGDGKKGKKKSSTSEESGRPKKKQRQKKADKEYGVSRGIDFKNVALVINFDLPTSAKSYTHRIGRTARAGQRGMALSFVVPKELYRKHIPTSIESAQHDEKVLAKIIRQQEKKGKEVKPYNFDMKQVEGFRYRMNDALRAVTKVAIREARVRELRQELLKSEKLRRHFTENPSELHHLKHDGELRTARTQAHLRHVPEYLLPEEGRKAITSEDIGFVPFKKLSDRKGRRSKSTAKHKGHGAGGKGAKSDPLRTFRVGKGKSK